MLFLRLELVRCGKLTPSIVKRKKFLDFLDKKAQVEYKVFLEKNSIDESEVSTET
jgi:hypothetical protein